MRKRDWVGRDWVGRDEGGGRDIEKGQVETREWHG